MHENIPIVASSAEKLIGPYTVGLMLKLYHRNKSEILGRTGCASV